MKSLGLRLALVISGVLLCLMLVADVWLEYQLTRVIYEEEQNQAEVHAKTLLASLQTLMLNGQGTLAREWLDRLHGAGGIVDIEVLRRDGSEAFNDLSTVEKVNKFLQMPRFQREPRIPHDDHPVSPEAFQKALQGETTVQRTTDSFTILLPIHANMECLVCHGYDESPLRGVLKLSLSTADIETHIHDMRHSLWATSVLLVLLVGATMWIALRFSVLRPIAHLRDAIVRVGHGERNTKLPVLNKDELGEVAQVFNRMQDDLQGYEARIRAVMDNVVDAIITIDARGIIESVNPAVKRMFGYLPHELIGENIKILMPEPYRSMHDEYLAAYQRTRKARVLGTSRELVAIRKDNSIFSIDLTISEMPLSEHIGGHSHFIGVMRDITERKQQMAALQYQALHDSLTDLPNRTLLSDRVSQAILHAQREGSQLALVLTDLDRFKEINDTLGHQNGDMILQQVSMCLRSALRESDTIARLGGDEFALLLPNVDLAQAISIVRKLIAMLENPLIIDEQALHVGASFGIAMYPGHGEDESALMRHADVAMYIAKRGNLGYTVYDPAKDQHSLRNLTLVSELRRAIDDGELILYYQPKILLSTGKVIGVEGLIRWHHPRYGLMLPDSFISLAEQTGLINPLMQWVITAALEQCRQWQIMGMPLTIAVNLSVRNLLDGQFADRLAVALQAVPQAARYLCLEITETAMMADPERALIILKALNDMGVTLSIDDFGTGYSSLAYIKQLPVNELKIDKSFVMGMNVNDNDVVIVHSTIDLAHNIGLKVVAEGVEDEATYNKLKELKCDVAQGYYISEPLLPAGIDVWVRESRWPLDESITRKY